MTLFLYSILEYSGFSLCQEQWLLVGWLVSIDWGGGHFFHQSQRLWLLLFCVSCSREWLYVEIFCLDDSETLSFLLFFFKKRFRTLNSLP